jgi:hypothetical protein
LEEKVAAPVWKTENTAVWIRCANHSTPSIRKTFTLPSSTSGGRSVGIVRSRTQTAEFVFVCFRLIFHLNHYSLSCHGMKPILTKCKFVQISAGNRRYCYYSGIERLLPGVCAEYLGFHSFQLSSFQRIFLSVYLYAFIYLLQALYLVLTIQS